MLDTQSSHLSKTKIKKLRKLGLITEDTNLDYFTPTKKEPSQGLILKQQKPITNPGLWGNTAANGSVVFTVRNANGGVSVGTGATFTANIGYTGTGANVTVAAIGGRAGRVTKECLVAMGSMTTANAASNYANLP